MALKQSLGRLDMPDGLEDVLQEESFDVVPIDASYALAVALLPAHHRDPFDRIHIVQAQMEGMTRGSQDAAFERYDVEQLGARRRTSISPSA